MEKVLNQILAELQSLKQGQARMEGQIGNLEEGQARMEGRMDRLETKLDKLEVRIENEVIDKIRVLFDADKLREEKLNQVIERLDTIEIDTGYLVARVSRLEKVAK